MRRILAIAMVLATITVAHSRPFYPKEGYSHGSCRDRYRGSSSDSGQALSLNPGHFRLLMLICFVRITIDLPDALHRKTKAVAALRGSSMKDVIVQAVERAV